jgi:hypothetical protein
VDFSVAYPTRTCPSCAETDCFYNGSYCRPDFKYYSVTNKGQLLIMEQLKQHFIFENDPQQWWDYVLAYDELCDDLAVVEECSDKIMRQLGIKASVIKNKALGSFGTDDNEVLRQYSQMKYNSSIVYYPSVIVNSIIYRGNLEPFEVYELLCESLDPQP